MVSDARLAAMNGVYKAATEPSSLAVGTLCGCGQPLGHRFGCSVRFAERQRRQAERDASCVTMCECGKPTTHLGMCRARWIKRKANNGPSGIKKTFNFDEALVADRDRMMRLARSWTRDEAQAEDLVSQASINILSNKEKFEIGSNFPAWCTTILKNLFMDSKRRAKSTISIEQENSDGEAFEIVAPALTTQPTQESTLVARDMAREVLALPAPQREAMLRAGAGQSLEQIARETGVAEGTVKSRISRGRSDLGEARVIPAVSRQNADSLDFVLSKLRDERDRITAAIVALEQCRSIFKGAA